ncbi:M23 family peptidase [Helicobacter cholecystus]|uniref:M23 family peptidase n=1 Tax=Helicobacter cholecystus TaxID=45498 RepID=A0A3D8IUK2_9HELI|nr:peptidoglycan DD-metalloendopeptidase family protein [Helicobacter cholecystus]RDU68969.1 M23 family peptidase [Helicobacter cholecystus]VEJ26013.1 M23/M37 family peptidase [Helicobacter cholecystus]
MKKLALFFLMTLACLGAVGENKIWRKGYTFLNFLEDHHIPLKLYYNLSTQDKELTAEIYAGVQYQVLRNKNGQLLQALIPIDEDIQIHIYKQGVNYKLIFTPIRYFQKSNTLALEVLNSPHQDIFEHSKDLGLANEFLNTYKNSINFKKEVIKGDKLALIYKRKYRFGEVFGLPNIQSAIMQTNKNPHYLIAYKDRYYNLLGKEVAGFLLQMPLTQVYITSRFSKARKHPVLDKVIRPHFGIDLRAKVGTIVRSAGSGKVLSAGNKGGYGKAIEIIHEGGLRTLYAHLSNIDKKVKAGGYVKQGQVIGKSGNTGISSGPHLHFGLYKNNRPLNPLGSIKTTRSELKGKAKSDYLLYAQQQKSLLEEELNKLTLNHTSATTEGKLDENQPLQDFSPQNKDE